MGRTCQFCGDGQTREKGQPAYYDDIDGFAHVECAREKGIGDSP